MKIVTVEQMRRIEYITIHERGIPGSVLMDRAGRAVVREAMGRFEPGKVAIVTGKGNNAGDGFVVARELSRLGVTATLLHLSPPGDLSGDALDAWKQVPEDVQRLSAPDPCAFYEQLIDHDLVIDAILGTGLRGSVVEPWSQYIQSINTCRRHVLSVDIPSGLPGDGFSEMSRDAAPPCVQATLTVAIGLPKIGMMSNPGIRLTGTVVVDDIGFPDDLLDDDAIKTNLLTLEGAARLLPARRPDGHKGVFGRLMILAGSEGMTGAAVLSARAATRSGVGLVYSMYPAPLGGIMESHLVEPVKLPLESTCPWFVRGHSVPVLEATLGMDAVAIGPGIGTRDETGNFLFDIVKGVTSSLVIDADGLNLLVGRSLRLKEREAPCILTPHPGEAARLLHCSVENVENDRLNASRELCASQQAVVVLKGGQTLITTPEGQSYFNPTGNSGLAKGGSGDVLTGLVSGLLAQGIGGVSAACLGVFLHGLAADIALKKMSSRAMLPSDVIEALGPAFLRLEDIGKSSRMF